jgi:hypothetical protein
MKEVGDHQQPPGSRRRTAGPGLGEELEDGVDLHQLGAGLAVEAVGADGLRGRRQHPLGTGVAVRYRVGDQVAPLVDVAEVDTPGVHAYRVDRAGGAGATEAFDDLGPERGHVPPQVPADHPRLVREPMDDRGLEVAPVEATEDDPAALGAEVDRDAPATPGHGVPASVTGTRWTCTPRDDHSPITSSGAPSSVMRPVRRSVATNGWRAKRPSFEESNSP